MICTLCGGTVGCSSPPEKEEINVGQAEEQESKHQEFLDRALYLEMTRALPVIEKNILRTATTSQHGEWELWLAGVIILWVLTLSLQYCQRDRTLSSMQRRLRAYRQQARRAQSTARRQGQTIEQLRYHLGTLVLNMSAAAEKRPVERLPITVPLPLDDQYWHTLSELGLLIQHNARQVDGLPAKTNNSLIDRHVAGAITGLSVDQVITLTQHFSSTSHLPGWQLSDQVTQDGKHATELQFESLIATNDIFNICYSSEQDSMWMDTDQTQTSQ